MAKAPLRIADALGFGSPSKPYVSPYLREVAKIKPGQKLPGTITRAPRPSAATQLAQLLTPNTRFGNELATKIAGAVDYSPLSVLTGLVDARRAYQADNPGKAAGLGILAALGAVPGVGGVEGKVAKNALESAVEHEIIGSGAKAAKIKISDIEHGESIFPGGKLTWPGSRELVKKYAEMDTPFPAIELMKNDAGEAVPYMIYDGSHRLEAAKLRGDKYINAIIVGE